MAESTLVLKLHASGVQQKLARIHKNMQSFDNSCERAKGSIKRFGRSAKNSGNNVQKFGTQSAIASKGVNKLGRAIKGLFIGLSIIQGLRFTFMKTAELETQRKSLEVLTGSLEKTNQIISELQEFGSVTPFTSSDLIESGKRLKAFGVDTGKLVSVTKQLSDVAGAVGKPLGEVVAVYGKIQAKGRMTMEELLQFQERGINVTDELSRLTGLYGNDLLKAMSKGKLGAGLVEQAFINLTKESGLYFEGAISQSQTLNGKFSTFMDNVETFARNLGQLFEPAFKFILDTLNIILGKFNKAFKFLTDAQIGASNRLVGSASFKSALGDQDKAIEDITKAVTNLDTSLITSEADAEKFLGQLDRIFEVASLVDSRLEKGSLIDKLLGKDNEKAIGDILLDVGGLRKEILKLIPTLNEGSKPLSPENLGLTNLNSDLDKVGVKWEQIRETIASGLTSAIEGLIAGTKSLGESLAGIAKSIASMYLKSAITKMLPGLPKSAEGRYASSPMVTSLVEKGEPEYVIPAGRMEEATSRYNSGMRGDAVIPRGGGSSNHSGGSGGATVVSYNGPILSFNSEDYVPKSAIGEIIARASSRGAKAGEARTISSLKNSRSRRSTLGL